MPTHLQTCLQICAIAPTMPDGFTATDLAAEIGAYSAADQRVMLAQLEAMTAQGMLTFHSGRYRANPGALAATAAQAKARPLPLQQAEDIAAQLLRDLDSIPTVQRLQVAGSVRRRLTQVKDIELVALVDAVQVELFGGTDAAAPAMDLTEALKARAEHVFCSAQKMTRVVIEEPEIGPIRVDLFQTCDAAQWGMLYFIRTGSTDFVRRALTYWKRATRGGKCADNRLRLPGGKAVDTPEEEDVFRVLSEHAQAAGLRPVPYIPPEKRNPR